MKIYAGVVVLCFILAISIIHSGTNIISAQGCSSYDNDADGYPEFDTDCSVIDCDDTDPAVNPGKTEVQYDGIDQNCDGIDAGYTVHGLSYPYVMGYDGEEGSLVRWISSGFHLFSKLTLGPDGYLYGVQDNGVYHPETPADIIAYDVVSGEPVIYGGVLNANSDLVFGPDGRLYGLLNTCVRVYDSPECAHCLVNEFCPGINGESRLAFGPDGYLYVSYGQPGYLDGNTVSVFDAMTGQVISSFQTDFDHTYGIAFGPDGYLYGYDPRYPANMIKGYHPSNGMLMNSFPAEIEVYAYNFVIDSEGKLYVQNSGMIVMYDIQSGSVERMFENPYYMRSIALGPRLISGSASVKIDRLPFPVLFASIQDAYDDAVDLDAIQIQAEEFDEDVDIHSTKSVFIEFGYDSDFSNSTGTTTINGSMTVRHGALTLSEGTLVIQ